MNFEDLKSFTTDLIKNQMQQYGQAIPDEKELDGIVARVMSNKDEIKRLTEQLTSSRILNFFKDNFNYKLKNIEDENNFCCCRSIGDARLYCVAIRFDFSR